jgi:hypothetical protein
MAMRNSFLVLFVRVLNKFSEKNRDKAKSENSDKFKKF